MQTKVITIKPKNLKKYAQLYEKIPDIQFDRIREFLSVKKFTKKDIETFHNFLNSFVKQKEVSVKIIIDVIPEATPRPRLGQGRFYVKNSRSNNEFVKKIWTQANLQTLVEDKPCSIDIKNYFPIPKSFNKVASLLAELGIIRPIVKPDWDNLGKTYSDAIQPWIVKDDALIVDGASHKYYSMKPRVEILIKFYE